MGSVAVRASNAMLGYVGSILVARLLGANGLGLYSFSFAVASALAIPGQYGVATLVTRETAKLSRKEHWGLSKGLWNWAVIFTIGLSVMLALLTATFIWLDGDVLGGSYRETLLVSLPLIIVFALMGCVGGRLRGMGHYVLGQLPEYGIRPFLFVCLIIAGADVIASPDMLSGASTVMAIQVMTAIVAFVIAVVILETRSSRIPSEITKSYRFGEWLPAVLSLIAVAGVQFIVTYTDIIMLGVLMQPADVGLYRVASQTALLVAFFLQAMTAVVAPQFARAFHDNDLKRLQSTIDWSASLILYLSLPFALILMLAASPILVFVFGAEFAAGSVPLTVLIIGQLGNVLAGSVASLLSMSGFERDTAKVLGVFALANIILNAVLIPQIGLIGASIATASCLIGWNIVLRRLVRKRLGVEPSPVPRILGRLIMQ